MPSFGWGSNLSENNFQEKKYYKLEYVYVNKKMWTKIK